MILDSYGKPISHDDSLSVRLLNSAISKFESVIDWHIQLKLKDLRESVGQTEYIGEFVKVKLPKRYERNSDAPR